MNEVSSDTVSPPPSRWGVFFRLFLLVVVAKAVFRLLGHLVS